MGEVFVWYVVIGGIFFVVVYVGEIDFYGWC